MSRLSDTSPEADRVLTEAYRRMSMGQKWLQLAEMYGDARSLHAAGVRLRKPAASRREINEAWLHVNLGLKIPSRMPEPGVDPNVSNLRVTRAVINVFTSLGIPYALGGSMASSLYGIDRYSRDADITVEPFSSQEQELIASFGPEYYLSRPAVQEANRNRSSFNIINTSMGFKVDVFIRKEEPFELSAMARRKSVEMPDEPGQPIVLLSPEDLVLFKLRWYRQGNESSEQQWRDVQGVLKVQAGRLEEDYLKKWAAELGLSDLYARAWREAQ